MFGLGSTELIVALVIILILFGPKNLPKLAKSMGSALRDFKSGVQDVQDEVQDTVKASSQPAQQIDPVGQAASAEVPPTRTAEKSPQEGV